MRKEIYCGAVLLLLIVSIAGASTFEKIDDALNRGLITREEAYIYKAYAVSAPSRLPFGFESSEREKCATPLVLELLFNTEDLSPSARSIIMSTLSRPILPNHFDTLHFRIHYTLTGPDRVPNEAYVHKFAQYFEQVYRHLVAELGYLPPPSDGSAGGNSLYDVYIKSIGVYGYTEPEAPAPQPWNDYTSFIVVNNDYTGFYTSGDNAMKVTAAHEFHHAIQFAYNVYADRWFMECCGVWSEEENYPAINDCYQYLTAFFNNPQVSLTDASSEMHSYSTFIWAKYLAQHYSTDLIRNIWENCKTSTVLSAMQTALSGAGSSRNAAFSEFARINYFTGSRATPQSYDDARDYPLIRVTATHNTYPVEGRRPADCPSALACNYIEFNYPPGASGPFTITFDGENGYIWNVQIMKLRADLTYDLQSITLNSVNYGQIQIEDWSNYQKIVMIPTVLSSSGDSLGYSYSANFAVITPTLLPPRNLRAISGISGQVPLMWDPPEGTGFEEIYYDDGSPMYYYPTERNDIMSVRFTPANPCTVKQVKLWFASDEEPPWPGCELHIWADNGEGFPDFTTDLMPPKPLSSGDYALVDWTVVDIASTPVVINPATDFHIGIKAPTGGISVYTDADSTAGVYPPRTLFYQDSDGYFYRLAGDLMIRAGVRYITSRAKAGVLENPQHITARHFSLPTRTPSPIFMRLAFVHPSEPPIEYFIYRSLVTGGPYSFIASVPGDVTTYTDNSVTDGVTYYYVVKAHYRSGESAPTNEASATPGTPPSTSDTLIVDDNRRDVSFYWIPRDAKFANKFHTATACQILKLYYLTAGTGVFIPNVHRWTGSTVGEALMPNERVSGENGAWTVFDVTPYDIYVSGDFVVSFTSVDTTLALAVDTSGGEGIGWQYYSGSWISTRFKYYIRVELRYLTSGETYTFYGVVNLSDMPPSRAGSIVSLSGTSFADTTDAGGNFEIRGVPPGIYTVKVSHPGYTTYQDEIAIYYNRYQTFMLVPYAPPTNPPRMLQARSYLDSRIELHWLPPYGQPGTIEEIHYDDGHPKYYYNGARGDIEDTRFTVSFPCTLLYVALSFYDSLGRYPRVRIHIFADDGYGYPDTNANLTTPIDTMPVPYEPATGFRWTVIDLSERHIVFAPGTDFHIAYKHLNDPPALLSDTLPSESPSRSKLYVASLRSWQERSDYMTRAIVKYYGGAKTLLPAQKNPAPASSFSSVLLGSPLTGIRASLRPVVEIFRPAGLLRYSIIRGTSPTVLSFLAETTDTMYVDSSVTNGTQYYYQVKAIYSLGESEFSNLASAKPLASAREPKVLLVDDDGSCYDERAVDEGELYIQYMNELSIPFKAVELLLGEDGPSAEEMANYRAVLWWTGIGYTGGVTLSERDESELARYLSDGGRLFLTGQDYLWDRYLGVSRFSAGSFPYDYLTITRAYQDQWEFPTDTNMTLVGQDSTIAEGMRFGIRNPFSRWAVYPDNLSTLGLSLFSINQPSGAMTGFPAVQVSRGAFKVIFSTMPLASMVDRPPNSSRREFLRRMLLDFFQIYPPAEVDVGYHVLPGWNQISVPVTKANMHYTNIFPPAIIVPPVYSYNTDRKVYERADTLKPGKGYFALFMRDTTFVVRGQPVQNYTLPLSGGWNMIGSVIASHPTTELSTTPAGILLPQVHWYNPGLRRYEQVTSIEPGKGCWVLAMSSAVLNFPGPGRMKESKEPEFVAVLSGDGFELKLAAGEEYIVPVPPYPPMTYPVATIVKDKIEAIACASSGEFVIRAYENIEAKLTLSKGYTLTVDGKNLYYDGGFIRLEKGYHNAKLEKPSSFLLYGNYPNPFNTSTIISIFVPERCDGRFTIYDLLGRVMRVSTIELKPGKNDINISADGLSSGLYFYRIELAGSVLAGKMLLLK